MTVFMHIKDSKVWSVIQHNSGRKTGHPLRWRDATQKYHLLAQQNDGMPTLVSYWSRVFE